MTARWIAAALLLLASPAVGQEPVLEVGDTLRVRVVRTEGEGWQEGVLQEISDQTLRIRTSSQDLTEIPLGYATELEVKRGTRGHHRLGCLVGMMLGIAVGYAIATGDLESEAIGYEVSVMMIASLGGLAGCGIGAFVGTGFRSPSWEPVELPAKPMVAVQPTGRFSVGVSIPLRR